MKLRFLVLPAVLLLAFIGVAGAQTTNTPPATPPPGGAPGEDPQAKMEARIQHQLDHLTKALSLTADQQTKISAILHDEAGAIKDLMTNQDLAPADKKSQMKDLRDKYRAQIADVLTPDQKATFAAMPDHGPRPSGDAPAPAAPPAS